MRRIAKPPGTADTAPRGNDLKSSERNKGRVDHIIRRNQTLPHTPLNLGRRGYVYRQINGRGDRVSG